MKPNSLGLASGSPDLGDAAGAGGAATSEGPTLGADVGSRPEVTSSAHHGHAQRSGRRRKAWIAAVLGLLVVVGGSLWWYTAVRDQRGSGRITVTDAGGSPLITITTGSMGLGQLRSALAARGHGAYLQPAAQGGYVLTAALTVSAGAHLKIDDQALLLHSDTDRHVRITVQGELLLVKDTVSSWTSSGTLDSDLSDGRADIVAQGPTARLQINNSVVAALGADNDQPGVEWLNGASGGAVSSTFRHDFRGGYANLSGVLAFASSSFDHNTENGLLLLEPAKGTSVQGTGFSHNGSNGLDLSQADGMVLKDVTAVGNRAVGVTVDAGTGLQVSGAQISDNGQQGISLTSSSGTLITGTKAWGNVVGILVAGGQAEVDQTLLSGNVSDGMTVTGPNVQVALTDDRLDHNARSGLWVGSGTVTVNHSLFDVNDTGILVNAASVALTASEDTLSGSTKDAFALTGIQNLHITGNTITGSRHSVFSLSAKADISALLTANTIGKGQIVSRVRAS